MPRLLSLLFTVLLLPACQRPPMAMPTMFEAGQADALGDTPAAWRSNKHTIFYATDRQFDQKAGPFGMYDHRRSDRLDLGQLVINLGDADAWNRLSAATAAQPNGKRPHPEITAIKRQGSMPWRPAGQLHDPTSDHPEQAFINKLNAALKQSKGKEITIFIHGFKNSFEEAALTTAEISLYSAGLGPFIVYSWPSYDSLFEYSHDRDSVRYTTAHARRFIERLANQISAGHLDATRINLVAHSSGAEIAGSVLRELGLMSHTMTPQERKNRWHIGDVLLVAPDISTDVALERILKEDLRGMYDRIVVYTSKNDTALRWASRVLYRTARIGSVHELSLNEADRRWLGQANNVSLINIDSQPNDDPARHSHHRHSSATISDILLCLRADLTPNERGLTRSDDELIWRFAENYADRVTEAAIKVYGKAK